MRTYEQADHADLGIRDDDRTEYLRPGHGNALGRCSNTAEGQMNNPATTAIGRTFDGNRTC